MAVPGCGYACISDYCVEFRGAVDFHFELLCANNYTYANVRVNVPSVRERMADANPRNCVGNGRVKDGITSGSGMGRFFKLSKLVGGLFVAVVWLTSLAQ